MSNKTESFPKIIHFVWLQGYYRAVLPSELADNPPKWAKQNPGWEVKLWDWQSLTLFIENEYPQYFRKWNNLSTLANHKKGIILRCDFARLLILHHFGGAYIDIDMVPNPSNSLDNFLDNKVIYNRFVHLALRAPDTTEHPVNYHEKQIIMSREYQAVMKLGEVGIANGFAIAKPRFQFLLDFLDNQIDKPHTSVLRYLGPHALTEFIVPRVHSLAGKMCLLPPSYVLHEASFGTPSAWNLCTHPAQNYWGLSMDEILD